MDKPDDDFAGFRYASPEIEARIRSLEETYPGRVVAHLELYRAGTVTQPILETVEKRVREDLPPLTRGQGMETEQDRAAQDRAERNRAERNR